VSEGTFTVGVKYQGEHIQRSPFVIELGPEKETHQRNEYEIEKKKGGVAVLEPLPPHQEIQFTVPGRLRDGSYPRASECVGVVILGEDDKINVRIESDDQPNTFKVSFDALKHGKHKISITHNGAEIANSPFTVNIPPEAFKGR